MNELTEGGTMDEGQYEEMERMLMLAEADACEAQLEWEMERSQTLLQIERTYGSMIRELL